MKIKVVGKVGRRDPLVFEYAPGYAFTHDAIREAADRKNGIMWEKDPEMSTGSRHVVFSSDARGISFLKVAMYSPVMTDAEAADVIVAVNAFNG